MQIVSFQEVAQRYKAIFFDSYGVLKNSRGTIPGIETTFQFLRNRGIQHYLLTNDASRSPEELSAQYLQRGINDITPHRIISSCMLALDFLDAKVNGGTVAYLGTEASAHYVEMKGHKTVSISDLDLDHTEDVNALVFLDDEGFDWSSDLTKVVNLLRLQNMPVIVANTDYTYPVGRKDVAIAVGGLAHMIEKIVGRKFIRFGKPDSQIFQFAFEHIQMHGAIERKDILMVGDSLGTDILGGNKFGIDTCLVLTGNTPAGKEASWVETTGIIPDWVCESVVG